VVLWVVVWVVVRTVSGEEEGMSMCSSESNALPRESFEHNRRWTQKGPTASGQPFLSPAVLLEAPEEGLEPPTG